MTRKLSVLVVVAFLAGCMGDAGVIPASVLPRLVLQPTDLPGSFERFDEGRQAHADQPGGRRAQQDRFGRRGGWKARYRRRGGVEIRGPLVIESRADLFDSDGGAEDELEAISGELALEPSDRGIGDEAVVASTTQPGFPRPLRTVTVAWRSANVVASLTVNGFQGRLHDQDALRIARLQQARIAAASG